MRSVGPPVHSWEGGTMVGRPMWTTTTRWVVAGAVTLLLVVVGACGSTAKSVRSARSAPSSDSSGTTGPNDTTGSTDLTGTIGTTGPSDHTGTTATSGPARTSATSGPPGGGSPTPTVGHPRREYPHGGPVDQIFPPGDPAYQLLTSNQCSKLLAATASWTETEPKLSPGGVFEVEGLDTVHLYISAADICLGRWDDAKSAFAQMSTTPTFNNHVCSRTAVLQWVTALIGERANDPNFAPVFVPSTTPSSCPHDG